MMVYTAYGLRLRSQLHFPNLPVHHCDLADVAIRLGPVGPMPEPVEVIASGPDFCVTKDRIFLFWEHIGTLAIRKGCEIIVERADGADDGQLRSVILGQAMALLLHQLGRFVLHASAVALNGGTIAFMGDPGQGKSTLAFTLCALGHRLVADDITSIVFEGHIPLVVPAYPQLNVWPETLRSMSRNPRILSTREPTTQKHAYDLGSQFENTTLPLKRIYVLDTGTDTHIEALSRGDAFVQLDAHSYNPRTSGTLNDARHFFHCANIVKAVPIHRITMRRSLEHVPKVAQMIETDDVVRAT